MDEQKKYEVIKALANHPNGNKERAALALGCTKRHINRMIAGYRKEGKAFQHDPAKGAQYRVIPLPYKILWSEFPALYRASA